MTRIFLLALICISLRSFAQDTIETDKGNLTINPVTHATLVLEWDGKTIYVDPTGGASAFAGMPAPDLVLITDIHGDHFNKETLEALDLQSATIVVPAAVEAMMDGMETQNVTILDNGKTKEWEDIEIEAIPMYNLPESPDAKHTKGRGNGYVLNMGGKRVYLSGDTADIPEMRDLKNIDVAFVCMNLPYTMDVDHAADAVLDFKPKIVYPYHYRGADGFSDVDAFKEKVESKDKNIEVRLANWYPNQ